MDPTKFSALRSYLVSVINKQSPRGSQGQTVRLRETRTAIAAMAPALLPAFEAEWSAAEGNATNEDAVIGHYAQALVDMIPE